MDITELEKTNVWRNLIVSDTVVRFICPNCGQGVIIRSNKEKKLGLEWKCLVCGYTGP
ncbi:MAG: zinc finger domain-containing protein [Candidatus Nanopusillus sp.]